MRRLHFLVQVSVERLKAGLAFGAGGRIAD